MSNKKLSERLNNELDNMDVPALMVERIQICSKMFKLPPFKIEALLNGIVIFDTKAMQKIADELDVSRDWLLGNDDGITRH